MSRDRSGSSSRGLVESTENLREAGDNQAPEMQDSGAPAEPWMTKRLEQVLERLNSRIQFPFLLVLRKNETSVAAIRALAVAREVEVLISNPNDLPVSSDLLAEIRGNSHRAKCLFIKDVIASAKRFDANDTALEILIPSICAPMVVGSRGSTLQRVRKDSGLVDVKVDERSFLDTYCRTVRMGGCLAAVIHGLAGIEDIVADYVGNGKVKTRDFEVITKAKGTEPKETATLPRKWEKEIEKLNRDPRLAYRLSPEYDPRKDPSLDPKLAKELADTRGRRSRSRSRSRQRDLRREQPRRERRRSLSRSPGSRTPSRSRSRNPTPAGTFVPPLRCLIPAEAAGWIIGTRGRGLASYKEKTGADVLVNRTERPDEVTDRFVIINAVDKDARIRAAERVIQDIREYHENKTTDRGVFVLVIPEDATSVVLGTKGSTVVSIRKETDCEIDIPKEKIPGTNDKAVKIVGTLKSSIRAVERIQSILDEHAKRNNMKAEHYDVPGYKARR